MKVKALAQKNQGVGESIMRTAASLLGWRFKNYYYFFPIFHERSRKPCINLAVSRKLSGL